MTALSELLAAYRATTLPLPAVFDRLTARGPVSEQVHQRDLALLAQLRVDGALDPAIIDALLAKLALLQGTQASVVPVSPADVDATVVMPMTRPPLPSVEDVDATRVQSVRRPAAPHACRVDDATVVKPASAPVAAATADSVPGATQVKPISRPSTPPVADEPRVTGTSAGIGTQASSWEDIADAEGGQSVVAGSLLKGRFQLEKEIGRGGMGVVFKARDERKVEARDRDPYVAVKVLNDEFRRHPDSLIALQRESRRSQQLAHDNIVRVFDFDKDGTIVFMTMEYIDGSDLKQLIRERAYDGMPLAEARPLIEGMARALARAHGAGVVHSDFKPANVMVTREGVPKVFDFGIARAGKHMGEAVGEQTVFDAGTLGALTPAYASLEMIQGKDPTPSDDVYALGCVAFELLTGKHPFDKASAEVAMKEGRKPPPVKGLTKLQYKALCASVAFTSEQRLTSATALVDGLREIGLRERTKPFVIYGTASVLLLAAGTWGVISYRHSQMLAQVAGRFELARPDHYVDEGQLLSTLNGLSEDDRKRTIIDQSRLIQTYLLDRIDTYWNPAREHYNYVRAQQIFKLRDDLQLYSPAMDLKRTAVDKEKNDLLNTLDTQLARQVAANAIFADQPDNVVATLTHIRAIDPTSALLKNGELELKYDTAIGKSIAAGQVDVAKQQLTLASGLFPGSARLQQRRGQLLQLDQALAAQTAPTTVPAHGGAKPLSVVEARQSLQQLAKSPTFTADWQTSVITAAEALHADRSLETQHTLDVLGTTIANEVARLTNPQELPKARGELDFGLKLLPKSAPLLAQGMRLDALQKQADASLAEASANAEVKARIESMRSAAAAADVDKASQSLARIGALQPDNPFLKNDGPKLLADAYLGLARDTFQKNQFQRAADVLGQGLTVLGDNPMLQAAKARYDLVVALLAAGKLSPSTTTY
ncbi:MAG: serine/threonine-protein kinase, partial [Rhodanobacter sp.]